nr:NACHT domain-containing protein [Leptolyngbya sp. FACHB-1624]
MPIVEVFDRPTIAGKLLILGKPGAGKTTTLLELARALVRRAIADPSEPMPFLLNLSSWKDPKQSIRDWATRKLIRGWGSARISSDLSERWLEAQKFLPLFDGLDEVEPELQPVCIQAINEFLNSAYCPTHIVVCSRQEEYELHPDKLNLNGAIHLQELNDEQIESYLIKIERPALWQVLNADVELRKLVRQPLLLSITLIAYRNEITQSWESLRSTQERVKFLLDSYVDTMVSKRINSQMFDLGREPSTRQMKSWIAFLAQDMAEESQTEFLIEEIQPYRLKKKTQQWQYWLTLFVVASLCSGLIIMISLLPYSQSPNYVKNLSSIQNVLLFSSLIGFIASTESKADAARLIISPIVVLFCLLFNRNLLLKSPKHLPVLHSIDLSSRLRIAIPSIQTVIEDCIEPLKWQSRLLSIFFFTPLTPIITLTHVLLILTSYLLNFRRFNRILRINLRKVNHKVELILRESSDSPYTHHFFLIGLALGYLLLLRSRGNQAINKFFDLVRIPLGFLFFLLFLPISFISLLFSESIEKADVPNQGVRERLKIAIFFAFLQSIYLYFLFAFKGMHPQWTYFTSLLVVCLFIFTSLPLIKHFTLRLVLWFNRLAPWNYARFLNYATERMFLQRIGGRYRFIHKLLQDHFAAMSDL